MNTELYDAWIKSHRVENVDINIADAVMGRISEKTHKPNMHRQTWENLLLNLIQAKVFVRACVLTSGAVVGILRMVLQIYSVLFT